MTEKNTYEYIPVKYETYGFHWKLENFQHMLEEHSKDGKEYIGFLPTVIDGRGAFKEIVLIFK